MSSVDERLGADQREGLSQIDAPDTIYEQAGVKSVAGDCGMLPTMYSALLARQHCSGQEKPPVAAGEVLVFEGRARPKGVARLPGSPRAGDGESFRVGWHGGLVRPCRDD